MTRGKEWRCSSFVSCRKEKKREKKTIRNKTKKRNKIKKKQNRGRRKRSFLSFSFGMKRKPRTWQSYEKDSTLACSFLCVYTFVVLVAIARKNMTTCWKKKKKCSDERLRLSFSFLFSFFRLSRAYPGRDVLRVARPRPDSCGVAYAWEREGVNIIINNVI